jgi:hypothetical protein
MNRIVLVFVLAIALIAGCAKKSKETTPDTAPSPATTSGSGNASGGGGGALMGALNAGHRAQAIAELHDLGLMIETMRDPYGKMPTKDQILMELKKTNPKMLKAIEEGSYILTGTTDANSLWAYRVDADKQDSVALIGGRAERTTPDVIQKYLGNN